jgi:AHBA synthesis associated protein
VFNVTESSRSELDRAAAPAPIRAVVFDLDGVLVDSFAVMREAFGRAYAEVCGPGPAPFREYARHLGLYFPDIMRIMGLPLELEAPFIRASVELADQVTVHDGVEALLDGLKAAGLRTAVATGKHGWRARSLLAGLGLTDRLDCITGSDEVPRPKPAPDIIFASLAGIGVAAENTLFVGDAVADMRAGQAAGVRCAAALWGIGAPEQAELLAENPDLSCASPADVLAACTAVLRS